MEVGLMDIKPIRDRVAAVRKEEQEKAQKREEEIAKQAQKREEEIAKQAQQLLIESHRQMVVVLVEVRFPSLVRFAKKAVKDTSSLDELQRVHRELITAPDEASAENLLDVLGEEDETV
jgi:hypothetical protein